MPLLLSRDSWIEGRAINSDRSNFQTKIIAAPAPDLPEQGSQKTNTIMLTTCVFYTPPALPNLGLNIPKNMHVAKCMMSLKKQHVEVSLM